MRGLLVVGLALPLAGQNMPGGNIQSSTVIGRIAKEMARKGIWNVPLEVRGEPILDGPFAPVVCTAPMQVLKAPADLDKAMMVRPPNAGTDQGILAAPPVPACPQA